MARVQTVDVEVCPGCGKALEFVRYNGRLVGVNSYTYEAAVLACVARCGVVIPARVARVGT